MELDHFLSKEQFIKIKSVEKQHAIRELLEHLQELGMIENKDRYYAQIIHRESLENTSIGNGFAIPHARTDTVTKFISIFGIHADGIDYQSIDGKPVKYIMLSIFPTSMSTRYLYLVGMTARIFSNKEKLALIDEAKTPSKIHAIMKKESNIYFDSISQKETDDFQKPVNLTGIPSSELDILIRIDRLYNLLEESTDKAEIQKKIDAMRSLIDNRSLTYYERMKKKRDNPFSIVEKDSCSGCHMSIPPIYRKEVHDGNQLMVCTHCGRFLIVV